MQCATNGGRCSAFSAQRHAPARRGRVNGRSQPSSNRVGQGFVVDGTREANGAECCPSVVPGVHSFELQTQRSSIPHPDLQQMSLCSSARVQSRMPCARHSADASSAAADIMSTHVFGLCVETWQMEEQPPCSEQQRTAAVPCADEHRECFCFINLSLRWQLDACQ
eukprot:Transcript_9160.p3 GENE.Transcript_9160~~Transcript_9160.p3  ORF type:complete len:166 (+),score=13.34 Transcript_9160:1064-1561(+)